MNQAWKILNMSTGRQDSYSVEGIWKRSEGVSSRTNSSVLPTHAIAPVNALLATEALVHRAMRNDQKTRQVTDFSQRAREYGQLKKVARSFRE